MPKFYFKERKRSRKTSFLSILLFLVLTPPIFVFYFHNLLTNPVVERVFTNPVKAILGDFISPIDGIAQKNLYSKNGDYAVVVKNLRTGETYYHNENMEFKSASLYKLWVMETAFQQMEDGKLSPDMSVSGDVSKLNIVLQDQPVITPAPTEASAETSDKKETQTVGFKVGDALYKMITISDNYAALLLTRKVGAERISNFLIDNIFPSSSFGSPPMTSAKDIASFYEKLYKWEFVSGDYSDQMLTILKAQQINDRIPKYLPAGTIVAHKTGELEGNKHDAGIVYTTNGDYIIVVLSKTDNPAVAAENIANFSKDVFAFETQR